MRDGNNEHGFPPDVIERARDLPMRDGNIDNESELLNYKRRPRPSYEGWKHDARFLFPTC